MLNYPYYNYSPFTGFFTPFIWIILIFAFVFIIVRIFHPNRHIERMERIKARHGFTSDTALEILKKRYAKGEITKKEFDEMRKHIS
ncbi:MAG TPA: SHOCT domain-containing protein [Patescibacteria group bacterium]|nr:SHOCT domain-containing protein [Patescibacteria group bacterium]